MDKKTNTILFICAATVFNIVTFFLVFLALFALFFFFSTALLQNDGLSTLITPIFIVIFIASIALSFVIYRVVLNVFMRKVDIEEYFTPVFAGHKKKPPQK